MYLASEAFGVLVSRFKVPVSVLGIFGVEVIVLRGLFRNQAVYRWPLYSNKVIVPLLSLLLITTN